VLRFFIPEIDRGITTRAKPRRRRVFPGATPHLVCAKERFGKFFWKQKGTRQRPLCYLIMFRVMELEAETEFALWKTPQIPLEIEYSLKVMDEILSAACAALGELTVGEREVGGVLFGEHRERSIRIKTWRPIVCQRTDGPTLRLFARDRLELACLLELARRSEDLKDLQPLGWFVSHPRTGVGLCASDLEVYDSFFPYAWQTTLIVQPAKDGGARCGFFARAADGTLRSDSSYREFDLEPVKLPVLADTPPIFSWAGNARPQDLVADPKKKPRSDSRIAPVFPQAAAIGVPPVFADRARPKLWPKTNRISGNVIDLNPIPRSAKWFWSIPILLLLGIAVFLLKPRSSPHFEAGPTGQGSGRLIVPSDAGASKAVDTPTPPPSDVTELRAERDALRAQVSQLEESVRKEADEKTRLQNLVGIHENRVAPPASQAKEETTPIQPAPRVEARAETPRIENTVMAEPATRPIARIFRPPSPERKDEEPRVVVLNPPAAVGSGSLVTPVSLTEVVAQIPPPPVKEAPSPKQIKVGGNLEAANLIKKVPPVYPSMARSNGIQGTVRFMATIGKDGTVQDLRVVSGNPLLVPAARDAVKKWVYQPTLLNGEPVEVTIQIDVNFSLKK
jgi:TonB family protein